ncbi:hypothetical protein P7K49_000866 [Saguinus oedipus]|uniref:histone deacetylase n=1 Tax=Saguinus oedipus TaxID=9490 RepID=A0ABQ9WCU7_SAGOE|nr:hypothetical protein P7K49_000866 [Saguinus oedipus]
MTYTEPSVEKREGKEKKRKVSTKIVEGDSRGENPREERELPLTIKQQQELLEKEQKLEQQRQEQEVERHRREQQLLPLRGKDRGREIRRWLPTTHHWIKALHPLVEHLQPTSTHYQEHKMQRMISLFEKLGK